MTNSVNGLPSRIEDADHAVEVLTPVVTAMAAKYDDDADDIAQEMWLAILTHLSCGKHDTGLLITAAAYAAKHCAKKLRNAGLTPYRSQHEPPHRVSIPGLGLDADENGEIPASQWPEPSCETVEASDCLLSQLLSLCETDDQREVVTAGARLKSQYDWDQDSVTLGRLDPLVGETGLNARRVRAAQQQLSGIFAGEYGHCPLNR